MRVFARGSEWFTHPGAAFHREHQCRYFSRMWHVGNWSKPVNLLKEFNETASFRRYCHSGLFEVFAQFSKTLITLLGCR